MRAEYLNPFIEAAAEVLQIEAGLTVQRGPLSLSRDPYTGCDVTVALNLIGAVEGLVLYGLAEETAFALLGDMLGEPVGEMDELARSGVGELGNVVTGRASIKLAAAGYVCDISTPTVILGAETRIRCPGDARLAVPLQTDYGRFEIHLALRAQGVAAAIEGVTDMVPAPARAGER